MKFLSIALAMLLSVGIINAQDAPKGGSTINKKGADMKTQKGGEAKANKNGAAVKTSKGKGVQADKSGVKTTPATK